MTNDSLLQAVEAVARIGGGEALRRFRGDVATEYKADGSPVTEADRSAERAMREWISARFPGDAIVGEELGETNAGGARRWFLDPIDGTKAFVRGVPLWGTLVGVAEGDRVLAGAVFCPAVSELVCAARGSGCWHNGSRARVSAVSELSRATVLTSDMRFAQHPRRGERWNALARAAGASRGWGDCYGYLLVATGRAEVMTDPIMEHWDSAAVEPVVVEAGGVFTDWDGSATAFGRSAIATNAALAAQARELLRVEGT